MLVGPVVTLYGFYVIVPGNFFLRDFNGFCGCPIYWAIGAVREPPKENGHEND